MNCESFSLEMFWDVRYRLLVEEARRSMERRFVTGVLWRVDHICEKEIDHLENNKLNPTGN